MLGFVVVSGALIRARWLDSRSGPEATVRAFFEALGEGDCEAAAGHLTRQSLAWLADPGGDAEGRDQFVRICEETIVVDQEGLELVSTEGVSADHGFATVRVVVRRAGGTEDGSEIDLVNELSDWGLDLSSLGDVLEMPDLATIVDPVDASDLPPPVRHALPPRRR